MKNSWIAGRTTAQGFINLGGNDWDHFYALALDNSGDLFVAGKWAGTAGYPVTDPGGGAYFDNAFNGGFEDGYISKFISDPPCLNIRFITLSRSPY